MFACLSTTVLQVHESFPDELSAAVIAVWISSLSWFLVNTHSCVAPNWRRASIERDRKVGRNISLSISQYHLEAYIVLGDCFFVQNRRLTSFILTGFLCTTHTTHTSHTYHTDHDPQGK